MSLTDILQTLRKKKGRISLAPEKAFVTTWGDQTRTHKSTGPFSIPNKIIHLCINEISTILSDIFNLSLTTGRFLTKLKSAKVIPLYKNKGSEQEISNFRPIALLSNLDKIFEKLAHKRFIQFLDKNKTIFDRQFGFRKNHSTNDNLLCLSEAFREKLDKGEFSCGIFLDLQKAFDSVDHDILLTELEYYGFRGATIKWIRFYLCDRKQYVSFEKVSSKSMPINYGVSSYTEKYTTLPVHRTV